MSSAYDATAQDARARFRLERKQRVLRLVAEGEWTTKDAAKLDAALRRVDTGDAKDAEIDGSKLERIDSAGAWLLVRTKREWEEKGKRVAPIALPPIYDSLLHAVEHEHKAPPVKIQDRHTARAFVERIGKGTMHGLEQGVGILNYMGRVTVEATEAIYHPRGNLRIAALFHQIEETGINALPIVGLLSFLIGIVLAYQGADQLKRFGAEIFTINLLGVGLLREIAGLITAIIIAGRSGSAFTAQIGTMRVNEEIDAMQTIGINTVDALVLPRVIGLVIALPFLTFYADLMGLIGGAVMCYFDLGITTQVFLRQLQEAISVNTFLVGMIKAPVFAMIISLVGCYEGLQVERNAASVGKLTTRSVVESIFLVIVFDAAFSIIFSILHI
ncbi:MAG: MlaE family lipid ABC transporter permease subunit [Alphaproteobacteria bacterium]|nr:MlaE family lipid ABC transporter permease subunit [Alphaproteobacteria bacterium]MBV9419120.1 MlaE family lipid ABC transporter permease subunit [Alphaproteobacteria bacterium]